MYLVTPEGGVLSKQPWDRAEFFTGMGWILCFTLYKSNALPRRIINVLDEPSSPQTQYNSVKLMVAYLSMYCS